MSDERLITTSEADAGVDSPHRRMLQVVTRSFCQEMIDYGVSPQEMVRVSSHVLDFAMSEELQRPPRTGEPMESLSLGNVQVSGASYEMEGLSIRPFSDAYLSPVRDWVARDDIQTSVLVPYPTDLEELRRYLAASDRAYHVICIEEEPVGMIGAEEIDECSRRLEMRKFIGVKRFRGRGIGTRATFLWLHHVFDVLDFNKVYIHTHHTNVRNINLNCSLGFELEGVLSQERFVRGTYVDILRMGLLRESWRDATQSGASPPV